MTRLNVPGHVHESVAPHGGSVLLDVRSGHCFAMNAMARVLWREWSRCEDFDTAVNVLTARYPAPQHDRIREDARRLADDLISRGLLAADRPQFRPGPPPATAKPRPSASSGSDDEGEPSAQGSPTAATTLMAAVPTGRRDARLRDNLAATAAGSLGLLAALLLIRLPFRALACLVNWIDRGWCRREATSQEAADALAAVRAAASYYPGRAACLEESLATLAALAFRGRRAVWCIGIADDPFRFHAWVEAQGVRVIPTGESDEADFRRVLSF
ncbi:lasso peptide biosynthesis B2 protein [Streptomyces hilarionis]|uniref:lasso peptide biosynthesis B2 protein n=1 Tax=Streptomyces hilarionis TaxID=2839954 RepID=UPI00211A53FE|nr:lasso peptide biosynthesis B2 protein [Streptomyces hilarionis]MCQ9131180.1 lasso peptide biosynthesis B2 protein [Streptomyces hilarionis]